MSLKHLLSKSFRTFVSEHLEYQFRQSLFMQNRDARFFRIDAVIQLSVEYNRASSAQLFSSAFGKGAIEHVMLGDWKRAREYANDLRFLDLDEPTRAHYAPNWETFVAMVDSICAEAERFEKGGKYNRSRN